MQSSAQNVNEYIDSIAGDKRDAVNRLRQEILKNLPDGFEETMSYGMIGYVVPHHLYPNGYHCNTSLPLPFMNIAAQKNFIAVYHMGIYSDENLMNWFTREYAKQQETKLDMGKSCIRFKKAASIPFELIGQLASKISVQQWIKIYESRLKK